MGFDSASGLAIYLDAELARMAWIGHSGVAREEISPGLRLHVVGVYSVYFRTTVDETRIVRLLRGSMDITGMDFSPNQDG